MWIFLFYGLLCSIDGTVNAEQIDYSSVNTRVIIENKTKWQYAIGGESAPIDSSEHGVTKGARETSCNCGKANRAVKRIVGGTAYGRFEYPLIAGVSYSTSPLRPHCGSTIITNKHFLTAAHCTVKAVGGVGIFVTVGEHERGMTAGSYTITVDHIIQHEGFNPNNLKHDICLLALKNGLLLSPAIGPACFPTSDMKDLAGEHVRIIGWGSLREGGGMQFRPQKIDVKVIDENSCNRIWPAYVSANPATQICTHTKNKSPCQGDSGGPVIWLDPETNRYTIVGIVSFGPHCKDEKPSVQTSVKAYISWIEKHVKATAPEQKLCRKV
uniref:Venom S1 protease 24 n=1 Tax=Ectomocoris sp. TaxID=3104572 RepID=A0AB38ZEA2_9HEMI